MRKLLAIVLTCCLVVPVTGVYTWLHLQKREVKREIKRQLLAKANRQDLVLMKFTVTESYELDWEHAGEFAYRGQMYDVAAVEQHADTLWYWCLPDVRETRINRQLEALLAQATRHNPHTKDQQEWLLTFLKTLYCRPTDKADAAPAPVQADHDGHDHLIFAVFLTAPPVPPPRIA